MIPHIRSTEASSLKSAQCDSAKSIELWWETLSWSFTNKSSRHTLSSAASRQVSPNTWLSAGNISLWEQGFPWHLSRFQNRQWLILFAALFTLQEKCDSSSWQVWNGKSSFLNMISSDKQKPHQEIWNIQWHKVLKLQVQSFHLESS